ncbi:MAG: acyl-CoA dehydrogenase [Actinomycetia bacterium]|jgi:alkylation response protein AidB-like acyl-CoA dehydrogenase|nr:acyl-CoA dehydrogenase [Actinomycetes bacterium]
MDFDLTEDQLALRAGANDVLDDLASPARVRAHTGTNASFDPALWTAMVDQGWLGVEVGEGTGGLGLGSVEVAVLVEELGRHAAPVPFVPTVLALDALGMAGDDPWVARLLNGDAIACVAWDPAAPVPYAPSADIAIVLTDDGVYATELGDAASGNRPRREPAMDLTRELGWLHFDPATSRRLGGPDARTRLLDRGATFTSADLLGSATRALDMSVEYAKDRVQFGRPIGSFQAVKHRCADMLVDVEGMRSTVYWAAWCIGAGDPDASVAASTAKIWCADASKRVMASALQVHGGIGFTWEHDLHFFLKRAQLDQLAFGDSSAHRERLAALLRPRVEAGESVV